MVIVNYDDLECPYCAKMHAELFPETLDHYNGLVKIVYRDLPLEELHPWAVHAAVNANCLAAQNPAAYWGYVDYLHTHGQDVTGRIAIWRRPMPRWTSWRSCRGKEASWMRRSWKPAFPSRMKPRCAPR